MKKIKLLSLLAVIPMLASCGGKPGKPHFAKVGNEVKFEKFAEDAEKTYMKAIFMSDKVLPSGVFKVKEGSYYSMKGTLGGEKSSMLSTESKTSESKYDQKNAILQTSLKREEAAKVVGKGTGIESSGKEASTTSLQVSKVEKKSCFVEVTKESKEFAVQTAATVKEGQAILDSSVKTGLLMELSDFGEAIETYKTAPEKEQKAYKFYENGKIFTIEASIEDNESHKGEDGKVDYVVTGKSEVKYQIDLTDGAFKKVLWGSLKSKVEIKKDGTSYDGEIYKKGDVFESEVVMAEESSYTAKDLTLKVFDLAGFTRTDKVEL